ncbi:DUF4367 domain-containing protein [Massiliimalia massiliensis]|uniref:DUF4367 domain-containing protein n=1 Tax=Massiliimalia massiliensis TaxID=1852384 RepID=UPI000985B767|nr:DUF4367 domain-containing protein [Massiliimalia massiliensis]
MKQYQRNLRTAFEAVAEDMIHSVPDIDYVPSVKLEQFVEQLEQKHQRKITIHKRIVVVFIAIVMLLALALQFEPIRRFIQEKFEEYTKVFYGTSYEMQGGNYIANTFTIGYLPEGFILKEETDMGIFMLYQFEDSAHYFRLQQYSVEDYQSSLDTEHQDMEQVQINQQEGTLIQIDSEIFMVWTLDDSVFTLVGNLSKGDMIQIAESITIHS